MTAAGCPAAAFLSKTIKINCSAELTDIIKQCYNNAYTGITSHEVSNRLSLYRTAGDTDIYSDEIIFGENEI